MLKKLRKKLKTKLIKFVTQKLLKAVTEDELLRVDERGTMICRGEEVPREMREQLAKEAYFIRSSATYKLLKKDMQFVAQQRMFDKSENFDDMLFGKAQLYVLDILDRKLKNLAD